MKLLALILITLNAISLLWQFHIGAFSSDIKKADDTVKRYQQIILVSELDDLSNARHELLRLWCAPSTNFDATIRNAGFVSAIGESDFLSGNGKALLIEEWLDFQFSSDRMRPVFPKIINIPNTTDGEVIAFAEVKQEPPENEAQNEKNEQMKLDDEEISLPDPKTPVLKEATVPKKIIGIHGMCYEAGPFDSMQHFYNWRKQTALDSASIKAVSRAGQKISDYMVYLPAAETYERSLANVEMLKQKGISDYWLFPQGESKGEISLGVFSNVMTAEKYKKQLVAKELHVSIKPRYKKAQSIYAQIQIEQEYEEKLIISRDKWQKSHPSFAIKVKKNCVFD